jgi:hypothetical protein
METRESTMEMNQSTDDMHEVASSPEMNEMINGKDHNAIVEEYQNPFNIANQMEKSTKQEMTQSTQEMSQSTQVNEKSESTVVKQECTSSSIVLCTSASSASSSVLLGSGYDELSPNRSYSTPASLPAPIPSTSASFASFSSSFVLSSSSSATQAGSAGQASASCARVLSEGHTPSVIQWVRTPEYERWLQELSQTEVGVLYCSSFFLLVSFFFFVVVVVPRVPVSSFSVSFLCHSVLCLFFFVLLFLPFCCFPLRVLSLFAPRCFVYADVLLCTVSFL